MRKALLILVVILLTAGCAAKPQVAGYRLDETLKDRDFDQQWLRNIDSVEPPYPAGGKYQIGDLKTINGKYTVYKFIREYEPEHKSAESPEKFHDLLMVKVDEKGKILDAYHYTLEWSDSPSLDLERMSARGLKLVKEIKLADLNLTKRSQGRLYRNANFNYSVDLPEGYEVREFPQMEPKEGIELIGSNGTIQVRAMGAGTMYENMPFDEYAKIAAASEIQNFEKLAAIKPFTSNSGIKGYETWWEVTETIPPDEPVQQGPEKKTVGPIFYFPPDKPYKIHAQPVKTIMINFYANQNAEEVEQDARDIARSFRYGPTRTAKLR